MFVKLTHLFVRFAQRFMPDPYLYAILLTIIVAAGAWLAVPGVGPGKWVEVWYEGVWGTQNIFTFALQMTLILVCGYTLAQAPLIERTLRRLASLPHNQSQAAVLVFLTGAITSFLTGDWGW